MTCPDRQSGHSRGPSGEGPEFWRGRGPRVKKEELTGPRPRSRCLGLPDPGTVVTGAPPPRSRRGPRDRADPLSGLAKGPGSHPGPPVDTDSRGPLPRASAWVPRSRNPGTHRAGGAGAPSPFNNKQTGRHPRYWGGRPFGRPFSLRWRGRGPESLSYISPAQG